MNQSKRFAPLKQNIANGFKQNLIPGLVLQSFALSMALCYYFWPSSQWVFEYFAELKIQYGWRYAAIATGLFGGVLPFIFLVMCKQIQKGFLALFLFYVIFWALKGMEVNAFYQLQALWFGNDSSMATVIKKTLCDQLIYSFFWAAPSITIAYLWRDCGFNFRQTFMALKRPSFWTLHMPTIIVSNWLVWCPTVAIIYSMPPALQLPISNLVLCFFVLLLATLSARHSTEPAH